MKLPTLKQLTGILGGLLTADILSTYVSVCLLRIAHEANPLGFNLPMILLSYVPILLFIYAGRQAQTRRDILTIKAGLGICISLKLAVVLNNLVVLLLAL
jgi:hypothetical protein